MSEQAENNSPSRGETMGDIIRAAFGMIVIAGCLNLPAYGAPAPKNDWCPPPGTHWEASSSRGGASMIAHGPSPKDDAVCMRIATGPGAGDHAGEKKGRVLGWYYLDWIATDSGQKKIENALESFLSGRTTDVKFNVEFSRPYSGIVWTNEENWKRVGTAQLNVGGHSVNTVEYDYREEGRENSNYHAEWRLWYDPEHHIWMKGEQREDRMVKVTYSFQVTSVKFP